MGRKKRSIAHSITHPKPIPKISIEEQEMNVRVDRAQQEDFQIRPLREEHFPFETYEVMRNGSLYLVEIRALVKKVNSCSCPDYKVNTLGSCKHIEAVLKWIRGRGVRQFSEHAKVGSRRVEIFLDQIEQRVHVAWPIDPCHEVQELLSP